MTLSIIMGRESLLLQRRSTPRGEGRCQCSNLLNESPPPVLRVEAILARISHIQWHLHTFCRRVPVLY